MFPRPAEGTGSLVTAASVVEENDGIVSQARREYLERGPARPGRLGGRAIDDEKVDLPVREGGEKRVRVIPVDAPSPEALGSQWRHLKAHPLLRTKLGEQGSGLGREVGVVVEAQEHAVPSFLEHGCHEQGREAGAQLDDQPRALRFGLNQSGEVGIDGPVAQLAGPLAQARRQRGEILAVPHQALQSDTLGTCAVCRDAGDEPGEGTLARSAQHRAGPSDRKPCEDRSGKRGAPHLVQSLAGFASQSLGSLAYHDRGTAPNRLAHGIGTWRWSSLPVSGASSLR